MSRPLPATAPLITVAEAQYARLVQLAIAFIVTTIESEGYGERLPDGSLWYDVRPLVSEHEHSPGLCDVNRELIDLGLELGVIGRHRDPAHAHLVHINVVV